MIFVCPVSLVDHAIKEHVPSHLISLLDPAYMIDTPQNFDSRNHHKVHINDITETEDGKIAPGESHVAELIDFVSDWNRQAPLLIHCWAGISRSTAAAFITMCMNNEIGEELALARRLREKAAHAQPNKRIIALADDLLKREGRMVDAINAIGPGDFTNLQGELIEGFLFGIPVIEETP